MEDQNAESKILSHAKEPQNSHSHQKTRRAGQESCGVGRGVRTSLHHESKEGFIIRVWRCKRQQDDSKIQGTERDARENKCLQEKRRQMNGNQTPVIRDPHPISFSRLVLCLKASSHNPRKLSDAFRNLCRGCLWDRGPSRSRNREADLDSGSEGP